MLRKIFTGAVLSLGLMSPLATSSEAQAAPVPGHDHVHCYHVYYRTCCHEPWRCFGHFDCRHEASHAARNLRFRGYEAFVR